MDRTKEFILQCEKAFEIQAIWKPNRMDFTIGKRSKRDSMVGRDKLNWDSDTWGVIKSEFIWLPRQDELQRMVDNNTLPWNLMIFYRWTEEIHSLSGIHCGRTDKRYQQINSSYYNSMEQLWLAFVMLKKFNKVWNGKEWVQEVT